MSQYKKYFKDNNVKYNMVSGDVEQSLLEKLNKSEELLKDIYQWLLSNDSLDGESEEDYCFRVLNEIPSTKELINKFFRENNE